MNGDLHLTYVTALSWEQVPREPSRVGTIVMLLDRSMLHGYQTKGDPKMRKGLLFAKRTFIFAKRTFFMAKTIRIMFDI